MTLQEAQNAVAEFMRIGGQAIPPRPMLVDHKTSRLRFNLGVEELNEYLEAAQVDGDIEAVADALADQLYILLGTAVAHGIDLEPVFTEVHRSNMTKFVDGKAILSSTGKVQKGPNYDPPRIMPILAEQAK